MTRMVRRGQVAVSAVRRLHRDEGGQSLAIILALVTILFLMGSALATHASVALRSTVANEDQAGDLNAADAGAELGMWWQRNSKAGQPPNITVNNVTVSTNIVTTLGPCPTPTPAKLTGFEHGAVSLNGGGLFSAISAGSTADAAVSRTGTYSLKVTDPVGSANNVAVTIGAATTMARVYIRLAALPAANVTELLKLDTAAGSDLIVGYQQSSQKLTIRFGVGAVTVASSTVTAGTWYLIDLGIQVTGNPRWGAWEINGVAQTTISANETASTVNTLRLGSTVAPDTFTANYDDLMISNTAVDYPIGPGAVVGLRPDGMGTHNTPGSFRDDTGTVIGATTYQRLDDAPMTSLTDYVRQQTIGNTAYIEMTMADTAANCIVGVSGVLAYHAATATADNGKTSFFDGGGESIVYSGDMSETTVFYKSGIVTPAANPWTTAAVNGLRARIGYSGDVTPNPYWDALLLEVATGVRASSTVAVSSTAGGSTVATGYTDVGNAPPTDLTWSTTK